MHSLVSPVIGECVLLPSMKNTDIPPQSLAVYSIRANPPKNLNVREAAEYLTISERMLRSEIASGVLRVTRFGSRIVIRLVDLDAFMEERSF
jgi:excisionase family DNA binding protein